MKSKMCLQTLAVLLFISTKFVHAGLLAHFQGFSNLNSPSGAGFSNTGFPQAFSTDSPFPSFPTSVSPGSFFPASTVGSVMSGLSTVSPFLSGSVLTIPASRVQTPAPPTVSTFGPKSTTVKSSTAAPFMPLSTQEPKNTAISAEQVNPLAINFFPNIPAGGLFTNLISGMSGSFRPETNWLTNDDRPGIVEERNPTSRPIKTNPTNAPTTAAPIVAEQPLLPEILQIPSTSSPFIPTTSAQATWSPMIMLTRPTPTTRVLGNINVQTVNVPQVNSSEPKTFSTGPNSLTDDIFTSGSGVQSDIALDREPAGVAMDREPGGVAIGSGALGLSPFGNPVKAPLPSNIRTSVSEFGNKVKTPAPSNIRTSVNNLDNTGKALTASNIRTTVKQTIVNPIRLVTPPATERMERTTSSPEQMIMRVQQGNAGSLPRSDVLNLLRWVSLNNFGKNRDLVIKLRTMLRG